MAWYAIFVQTGKEDEVCEKINKILMQTKYKEDYEVLVPKRKVQEKKQGQFFDTTIKMFPGYVLIRSDEIEGIYHKTKRCSHIYRFLQTDDGFEEIPLEEISNIIYLLDEEGVIRASDIFVEEDMVQVVKGPLCKYVGWIKKIDKHKQRASVVFKFRGQEHLIDLSIRLVKKPSEQTGVEFPRFRR